VTHEREDAVARKPPLTSLKQINEINLTPLMDLTFILLITFIITFPLLEQGISVNLPKGQTADLQAEQARTVTVDEAGRVYLDDVPVRLDELSQTMLGLAGRDPDVRVMVRADQELRYGKVVEVLKSLYDANITRMALVTEAEE
jgi:biopolymer transport protein ExbD